MPFSNQIAKYRLRYFGKRSKDTLAIAWINVYDDQNYYVGRVQFYRDGQAIPNNSVNENLNPKRIFLQMHERQIDTVVDMLRNEKPCWMYYSSPTFAYIRTGKEPVGEEESEE